MAVTLIRHTRVLGAEGLCYGRTDRPLADTFAAEAAAVRARLGFAPQFVVTSPSTRCRRLAEVLGAAELRVDARLLELNFGAWENRRWDDIPRAEVDAWAADFVTLVPPEGESLQALAARVEAVRRELAGETRSVAVITHAGPIRAWLCLAEGRPLARAFDYTIGHGECFAV